MLPRAPEKTNKTKKTVGGVKRKLQNVKIQTLISNMKDLNATEKSISEINEI